MPLRPLQNTTSSFLKAASCLEQQPRLLPFFLGSILYTIIAYRQRPLTHYIIMNVIFHRNCLDGAFASFCAFLASKLISTLELDALVAFLHGLCEQGFNNITDLHLDFPLAQTEEVYEIDEQFFHNQKGVSFSSYSLGAGEYLKLSFPKQSKLMLVLDTNLGSIDNIVNLCSLHPLVLIIDHHTSFLSMVDELASLKLKNLLYIFKETQSAALITYDFLGKAFGLKRRVVECFRLQLEVELGFVSANDRKSGQSRDSKCFVLGFYYFGVELSHLNPNLYKRIALFDLPYLIQKGTNLYHTHLKVLLAELRKAQSIQLLPSAGKLRGIECLYLEPRDSTKVSDLGSILAFISAELQFANLAILASKNSSDIRISCRSHRKVQDAMALQFAEAFGGGGHRQAAGCRISQQRWKSSFKQKNCLQLKSRLAHLSEEEIQVILLGSCEERKGKQSQDKEFLNFEEEKPQIVAQLPMLEPGSAHG